MKLSPLWYFFPAASRSHDLFRSASIAPRARLLFHVERSSLRHSATFLNENSSTKEQRRERSLCRSKLSSVVFTNACMSQKKRQKSQPQQYAGNNLNSPIVYQHGEQGSLAATHAVPAPGTQSQAGPRRAPQHPTTRGSRCYSCPPPPKAAPPTNII